ncbi:BgTH12-06159 [Blumeria graminis f. sp. triticale]|uniref:BgTH12-06159 n=1 Tax=Blumeria graminis f. sp. triticale TaxID=1689686 RepID=A0A9W4GGA5_BLUGR|nr:BgTH12-06159 [Blumeria graminis f. sp. triticale]
MINWRRTKGHRPHKHFLSRASASAKLNRPFDNFESFAEYSITFGLIRDNGSLPTIVSNLHRCQRRVLNP